MISELTRQSNELISADIKVTKDDKLRDPRKIVRVTGLLSADREPLKYDPTAMSVEQKVNC